MHNSTALALSYLDADPLRNIALRKFLRHYSVEHIVLHRNAHNSVDGALCVFETAQFGYDAKHYPNAQRMALIRHDTLASGIALLAQLPSDDACLVFKLWDDDLIPALSERYDLHRACSFISLTQASVASSSGLTDSQVAVTTHLPADCMPLLQANNYSITELQHYFEDDPSRCYALRDTQHRVLCVAISYANEDRLHEIAALFTSPAHRRKGYAKRVVHCAVQHIASIGKQVRYQVRDDNLASLSLAKDCGLTAFTELTHWSGVRRS